MRSVWNLMWSRFNDCGTGKSGACADWESFLFKGDDALLISP